MYDMRQCWSARYKTELVGGATPRGETFHCTDKAGYVYSAALHTCRVVRLLLRQLALANCNEQVAKDNIIKYFATTPAHTERALYGAQSLRGQRGKTT